MARRTGVAAALAVLALLALLAPVLALSRSARLVSLARRDLQSAVRESQLLLDRLEDEAPLGAEEEEDAAALLELRSTSPGLFHDAANGASFWRAPYLPATVNGPMYSRSGPQSGAAKAWLEKAAQPAWSALPFGPRTPSAAYVLPFDHMREVQDEFSWNYDHNNPAPPPQFAFAAPIFLEEAAEVDADAASELESPVEYVQAVEVDDLESALLETGDAPSYNSSPKPLIPDDFWSSRGVAPSFSSYRYPYHDLTNPTLHGTFADLAFAPRAALQPVGQTGYFAFLRSGFVPDAPMAHPMAYHQGGLPPFAHEIEPFKSMANTSPAVLQVGVNEEVQDFTRAFIEQGAQAEEQTSGCVNCQFN